MVNSTSTHKRKWSTVVFFLMGFYLIYQPNFWGAKGNYILVLITAGIVTILTMLLTPQKSLEVFNTLKIIIGGYLLAAGYYFFRAMLAYTDPRLLQNLIIILNVIALVLWLENVRKYLGFNNEQVIKWLLWMVVLQCGIAVVMMVDANIRSAILSRTANEISNNQFVYGERLYGLSGDYTFFTPIYHSIIGLCAIYLGMNVSKKYYLFLPFCLLIILLNGRTGLITLFIGFLVLVLRKLITSFKGFIQVVELLIIVAVGLSFSLIVLESIQPATYDWIIDGFSDTLLFVFQGERAGNYSQLAGSFVMTPVGIVPWLFGYGVRVYGGNLANINFGISDIGYVNDLFMGGLIYIAILYGSFALYMRRCVNKFNPQLKNSAIALALIVILLIANYKGESGRSGLILTSIIFLGYLWSTETQGEGDACSV